MFRKTLFWLHLICGVIAGVVIAIMSFTGAALAFEKELIAYAERDARRVEVPAGAQALPLEELLRQVRAARPDARISNVVLTNDPTAAIALTAGGRGPGGGGGAATALYANPYTGEVREAAAPRTRAFLRTMTAWHRWLGAGEERRAIGKAITGACNVAFLGLGLTGLYLWWPRAWSVRVLRAIALLNPRAHGKARDFNWHNAIGIWSVLVLIVLTATALPISYHWAGDAIYRLTGSEPPAPGAGRGGPPATNAPQIQVPAPPEGARRLGYNALVVAVEKLHPRWEQLTLRLPGAQPERGAGGSRAEGAGRMGARTEGAMGEGPARRMEGERPSRAEANSSAASKAGSSRGPGATGAVVITLKEAGTWPRTATTTLSLDPYTGSALHREGFADQELARQVRTWTRFLHTGEALGWLGQLIAGLASLGAVVLVYTGFALSWRRFFSRKVTPSV
ncbi:PepSY-associated TM helix domain-containing protein [Opitutus sp. ER46]|uniref:PepSY-associated TM helix domain-containing protein n=1 Tax=Opitutus sp. ER46 TaxID=2161864 RepID=UPI000D31F527|nr:PepSY-associated TM helix domain-containing protein [Opitutus sp. ER46]PTX92681.1 PepSY domain-containing protein [Opitutus sp. ER46]